MKKVPIADPNYCWIYAVESHTPIKVSADAFNLLIRDEYVMYDGREWLYFDSDADYIREHYNNR
jgi:hypothetical protein